MEEGSGRGWSWRAYLAINKHYKTTDIIVNIEMTI